MSQPTGDASASQIANNSIEIDAHPLNSREEIAYAQQLANSRDSAVNDNNNDLGTHAVVLDGDHRIAGPPLVDAPPRNYDTNNWTVDEVLVLQAAKLEFESQKARNHQNKKSKKDVKVSSKERWTWIENACWEAGVLRSHKQCHDKWEGVTTQFRKVEKFNENIKSGKKLLESDVVDDYWCMSQLARKQNKLPSHFSRAVFDALRSNHFAGGGDAASDSTLRNLGLANHGGGDGEGAAPGGLPNKKRKLEIGDEGALGDIATAILSAMEKADERHKELMEFERSKFEFEKEKFLGYANLGTGFVRALMSINEILKERFDGNCEATVPGSRKIVS